MTKCMSALALNEVKPERIETNHSSSTRRKEKGKAPPVPKRVSSKSMFNLSNIQTNDHQHKCQAESNFRNYSADSRLSLQSKNSKSMVNLTSAGTQRGPRFALIQGRKYSDTGECCLHGGSTKFCSTSSKTRGQPRFSQGSKSLGDSNWSLKSPNKMSNGRAMFVPPPPPR